MTGGRQILLLSAVALAVSLSFAFDFGIAQSVRQTADGPNYSTAALRQMKIAGIHLGMTRKAVADEMKARGFVLRNPSGREGAGYYESQDQRVWIFMGYSADGGRLDSFSYYVRNYSAEEASDVARRREELLALLGQPTQWTKWVTENGEIRDRFVFVPSPDLITPLDDAASCYVGWECASLWREMDCRPLVRQVRGAVIEGSFGGRSLNIRVNDYTQQSRALLGNERFRRRDLSQAVCPVPSVH